MTLLSFVDPPAQVVDRSGPRIWRIPAPGTQIEGEHFSDNARMNWRGGKLNVNEPPRFVEEKV
jgi:hypothetical protein